MASKNEKIPMYVMPSRHGNDAMKMKKQMKPLIGFPAFVMNVLEKSCLCIAR